MRSAPGANLKTLLRARRLTLCELARPGELEESTCFESGLDCPSSENGCLHMSLPRIVCGSWPGFIARQHVETAPEKSFGTKPIFRPFPPDKRGPAMTEGFQKQTDARLAGDKLVASHVREDPFAAAFKATRMPMIVAIPISKTILSSFAMKLLNALRGTRTRSWSDSTAD